MSDNDSIDKMSAKFTSADELKAYSDAQYKTILNQSKEISKLKAENNKLRDDVERMAKEITVSNAQKSLNPNSSSQFDTSDEETICVVQLAMLKSISLNRELTSDETKRFEIFTKTLKLIRGQAGEKEEPTKRLSNEELLALMAEEGNDPQ
jgi:hypothetical protein